MATSLIVLAASVGAVAPYERWDAGTAPALSAAATARVYFDSVSNTLKLSQNGGAYADIATGASSPWTRVGTTVSLGQVGDLLVLPFDAAGGDNTTDFGSSTRRWLNLITGSNGLSVYSTSGAANRTAFFGASGLKWGVGGATALDAGFQRTGVAEISVTSGDGGGAGGLMPFADDSATGIIGKAFPRWRSMSVATTGYRVFATAGAANPTSRLGSATLEMGAGVASVVDVAILRQSANTFAISDGAAGAGGIVPNADATATALLGTPTLRWRQVSAGTRGFVVYLTSGDANGTSSLGSATLNMGAGGVNLPDVGISRSAATANTIEVTDGVGGVTGGTLQPSVTATGKLGTTGVASSKAWLSAAVTGSYGVYTAAADANPTSALGNASLAMGAGGASAPDTRIRRTGAITMTVDDNGTATGRVEIVPSLDGTDNTVGSFLGTQALRFSQVNAFEVNTGDVVFTDETCVVCQQQFEEGQDLVMRVIKIHEGPHGRRTRTVPAHHGCK